MEIEKTYEMDKVKLLRRTPNYVEYTLPHGWKKFGYKRQNSEHWDFYLFNSGNKKFRSNAEVERYLKNNPNEKCDLSVTNTKWPSTLKRTNPDSMKRKSDQSKANLVRLAKLENNLSVTNTKMPSILKKPTPDSEKRKSDQSKANLAMLAKLQKNLNVTITKSPSTLKTPNPDSKKRNSDQPNEEVQIVYAKTFKKLENNEGKLPLSAAFRKIHPWQNCAYCGEVFQKADRDLDLAAGYSKGPVRSLGEHQVWCLKQRRLLKAKEAIQKARKKGE